MKTATLVVLVGLLIGSVRISAQPVSPARVIVCPPNASPRVKLAAHELRRYVYLRTGELLPIAASGQGIVMQLDGKLDAQQYRLKSEGGALIISGGSDVAVLYGAYDFVEKLGVRFYPHGDVIPDQRIAWAIPPLDETHRPLFELRGLQPFHDFPEGPDWWTLDDWMFIVGQATKMRMNFVGLHTYPFHNTDLGPEPTVWVGLPEDVNADGTVKVSDYASWYTTAKLQPYGCYSPDKTTNYSFGGADIFPSENYGPEVNRPDDFPMPKTSAANVALVNRTGAMLKSVFDEAHRLGMKTCVGTESPLDIPDAVMARLKELGLKADDPATLQRLYAGMFTRIQRAYPIDYYWIWGHEGEIDQGRFVTNLQCAHAALQETKVPFGLGICGWGWITGNFPTLDKVLPKDVVFSAISMSVGNAPVSENFGQLENRPKWAIPWFEDDGGLTSIQLRAGRVRRDAVDARRYGCNGLMGLHWRTRILSPNISALAQAGWEQGAWSRPPAAPTQKREVEVFGGQTAAFLNDKVSGTDNGPLYQTVRYGMRGYKFAVPDGRYKITLRFVEPAYSAPGKRVFGVKLQQQEVVRHLDVFAKVGQFAALDLVFTNVAAAQGELLIDFLPEVEYPCIAAIEVAGAGVNRKINCGGPEYQDYAADPRPDMAPRDLPVTDFYEDWASAQFGRDVGSAAAAIFTRLDGNFPVASGWDRGPGVMSVNPQPWSSVASRYAFVEEFAALRPRIQGAGNLERFDWWLNTFRFNKAMGQFGCARGELNSIISRIEKEADPQVQRRLAREEALPVRLRMLELLGEMYQALLVTLNNAAELGTVANIEQQSMLRVKILTGQDGKLEQFMGEPLPATAQPWKDYRGAPRMIVMTARTAAAKGESLTLKIVALDKQPVSQVAVHVRPLGRGDWQTIPAAHVARAVHNVSLPAAQDDLEYYVTAETSGGEKLLWPATAPALSQTVVISE
ncbi:MAG: malectin domain-containing carbohydrate-binding protein [Verrucomicrobia bacterium]|nr:malectin domain-containing carbohydrate-binding protein [Verrucomicrobiota bacterium]